MLYDVVQFLAGERHFRARLAPHLRSLPQQGRLVDVGGGTGLIRAGSAARVYVCLDLDLDKLQRFRRRRNGGMAIAADATACPLRDAHFDGVLCAKVVHHLNDVELRAMLAETVRILKPGGTLILADAVRSSRLLPRMLWRIDRGAVPRSSTEIRRALPPEYQTTAWEEFRVAIFHDVVVCTARRKATTVVEQRPIA